MFGSKKLKIDSFSNLVSEGTIIDGTIRFTGVILVKGDVKGDVVASILDPDSKQHVHCIAVAPSGQISSSEITASNIVIEGKVFTKKIWAEDKIRISRSAVIARATIYYRYIEIEPGATLIDCQLKHLDHCSEGEKV